MMWVAKKGKNFGSVRILIDYFQILFIFGSFKLQWPESAARNMEFFGAAMINIEMATPDCLDPSFGYFEKFTLMMVTPILFCGMLALSSVLMTPPLNAPAIMFKNLYRSCRGKELIPYEKVWNMESYKKNAGQAVRASNLFLQFAFANLVGWSLGFFNCQDQNGKTVNYKEPSIECGIGVHSQLSPLATFGIIAYVFGIPFWLCGLFYFQRQKRFTAPFFVYMKNLSAGLLKSENCSFNYEHHPFVVVQMFTKAILIFAQMYFKSFNIVQGIFVQIALLFYTGFLLYLKPYKNKGDNIVDMAAQVSSIITLCAGILFYNAKTEGIKGIDSLGGIVVAIIWCSIIGIIVTIAFDIRRKQKASKNEAVDSPSEEEKTVGKYANKLKSMAPKRKSSAAPVEPTATTPVTTEPTQEKQGF